MIFSPEMNKAQWRDVLKVQNQCLSDLMKSFLKNNREAMVAWCNDEPVETAMGKEPNITWYGTTVQKLAVTSETRMRIAPTVTISVTLSVKQANAFYRTLEENTFNSEGSRKARNSVMKAIDTTLKEAGY